MKRSHHNGRSSQSRTGVTKVVWRQEKIVRKSAWIAIRPSERTIWLPELKKEF